MKYIILRKPIVKQYFKNKIKISLFLNLIIFIMFHFLLYLSFSATTIREVTPSSALACFDLSIFRTAGHPEKMTQNGFFVALRVYDSNDEPGPVQLLKRGETIDDQKYNFSYSLAPDQYATSSTNVKFIFQNHQNQPMKIDIGVYADAMIQTNDNAEVRLSKNGRYLVVENRRTYLTQMILLKGSYYPDVDKIYFGEQPDEGTRPTDYPYWESNTKTTASNKDSVYAFSWMKREIAPKSEAVFGFLANPGESIKLPPFIFDRSEDKTYYPPNTDVTLKFEVIDYDDSDAIVFYANVNGTDQTPAHGQTDRNKKSLTFPVTVNLKDKNLVRVTAHAIDVSRWPSKTISRVIRNENYRPVVSFETRPSEVINPAETIKIKGTVQFDQQVKLIYNFDKGPELEYDKVEFAPSGNQIFDGSLKVPHYVAPGQNHTINIKAVTSSGIDSVITSFTFSLTLPNYPAVHDAYSSRKKAAIGSKITIFGQATDQDIDQDVTIYAQIKEGEKTNIGTFKSDGTVFPFAFFYWIPEVEPGVHFIKVWAEDNSEYQSQKNMSIRIVVYDPNVPQPKPQRGTITETEVPADSDACFNLKYTDYQKHDQVMTYNNEGFFVGYRIYDGNIPGQNVLLRAKDNHASTTGDITVKYYTQTEELSNFLQTVFNVTNDGYFPVTIDLGVFADSAFTGNDANEIVRRTDGRGITAGNDYPEIYYTIFMRQYSTFPDVSSISLLPIKRADNQKFTADEIPFWDNSDVDRSYGNSMYSFAWKKKEIPPGESLLFGVTFAPHNNLNTLPRIEDITHKLDFYEKSQRITVKAKVTDFDANNHITCRSKFSGYNDVYADYDTTETKKTFTFSQSYKLGRGSYSKWEFFCIDDSYNRVNFERIFPLTYPPWVRITSNVNGKYFVGQNITFSGKIWDEKKATLKYQFDNGRKETYGAFDTNDISEYVGADYQATIPIPEPIKPGRHALTVWAEDPWRLKSSQYEIREFDYEVPVYSRLLRAGFNNKVVHQNDKLLGFVAVSHPEVGKRLRVMARFDNEKEYQQIATIVKNNEGREAIAFNWNLPELSTNTHDVTFAIADEYDLYSRETVTKTLIVIA